MNRVVFTVVTTGLVVGLGCAYAAPAEPGSLASAGIHCKAPTARRTGPNGRVEVCLDRSYSTCVRDARDRLGWGQAGVERCNSTRAQGRIK